MGHTVGFGRAADKRAELDVAEVYGLAEGG